MDSQQLSRRIRSLLLEIEGKGNLYPAITMLEDRYRALLSSMTQSKFDNHQTVFQEIVQIVDPGIKVVRTLPFRAIFSEVSDLISALPAYSIKIADSANPIDKLPELLGRFSEILEHVIREGKRADFVSLITLGNELSKSPK